MSDDALFSSARGPSENEVAIDYIKSPDFRIVWADGAIGSITPNGIIQFAIYAERPAIPRRQVFKIEQIDQNKGALGAEVLEKQISRGSIVREMACDVFVSPQVAENLARWLMGQAAAIKKMQEEQQ